MGSAESACTFCLVFLGAKKAEGLHSLVSLCSCTTQMRTPKVSHAASSAMPSTQRRGLRMASLY
eukprot:7431672-Alexandrium_andersonii.AAC.1